MSGQRLSWNWRAMLTVSPSHLRALTVGAYSFSAFSVGAVLQALTGDSPPVCIEPPLGRLAFTALPLLASGLSLDFYCSNRPSLNGLASLLCAGIGILIGVAMPAFIKLIACYSPTVAAHLESSVWLGLGIGAVAVVAHGISKPASA